jgi:hypothetical protein
LVSAILSCNSSNFLVGLKCLSIFTELTLVGARNKNIYKYRSLVPSCY